MMEMPMETNKEYIWCAKLSGKTSRKQWEGKDDGAMEQLVLKRACLGVGAKDNERNVIQVTSFDSEQEKVEACICSLRAGKQEDVSLSDLTIVPPAIFTLVEGSGPVHLVGNHMIVEDNDGVSDDEDYEMDDEEVEESDEEEVGTVTLNKSDANQGKLNGKPTGKKAKDFVGQAADDDDDDEEDDDSEDFEDMDSDEEFDDEEDEVEEIPEPKVDSKKRKLSEQKAQAKKTSGETPLKKKKASENAEAKETKTPTKKGGETPKKPATPKTPAQQKENQTPGSAKKTPGKTYESLEEVKAAIKKFPGGKPKKEEKFCNWVRHTYKVNNEQWIKKLWKLHKKEMAL